MGDQNKELCRPIFRRNVNWDPFPNWTQPNRIFEQDFGLPPLLEPTDLNWLDWAKRRLGSFNWPGFTPSALLLPFDQLQGKNLQTQLSVGVSEIIGQNRWKVSLDVKQFSPEEITIATKEGFLQISGNHRERQDQHGSVSRCFTRKYKMPVGVDLQQISASLAADGVLSVEAPLSETITSQPANEIVIPVQIRHKQEEEQLTQ